VHRRRYCALILQLVAVPLPAPRPLIRVDCQQRPEQVGVDRATFPLKRDDGRRDLRMILRVG